MGGKPEQPKVTDPPVLGTHHLDGWEKRGGSGSCSTLTFTVDTTNPNHIKGNPSTFPQSCDASLAPPNRPTADLGSFIVVFTLTPGSTVTAATFSVLDSHSYEALDSLPSAIVAFVTQSWNAGIKFSPTTAPGPDNPHNPTPSGAPSKSNPTRRPLTPAPSSPNSTGAPPSTSSPTPVVSVSSDPHASPETDNSSAESSEATENQSSSDTIITYSNGRTTISTVILTTIQNGSPTTITSLSTSISPATGSAVTVLDAATSTSSSAPSKGINNDQAAKHVSPGLIAGAVIGGIILLILLILTFLRCKQRIRKNRIPPSLRFRMYAPSRDKLTDSQTDSSSNDDSSGITVTYSKVTFDDPLFEKLRETRRAYNDYVAHA